MNDVTVVTSVTYPSPESLALVADVQYHEPYLSAALNRKFRGIVDPGFYAGFLPKPGGGMNLLITSVDGDKTAGAASVDIGEFYQGHCCKVSDEAAFCLIQRPYISKTLLTRRISPRGSP